MSVRYKKLSAENFSMISLDNFQRYQEVFYCWRNTDGEYLLQPVHYIEDWNLYEKRELAEKILNGIINGNIAYAALINGEIVGFAFLEREPFDLQMEYCLIK